MRFRDLRKTTNPEESFSEISAAWLVEKRRGRESFSLTSLSVAEEAPPRIPCGGPLLGEELLAQVEREVRDLGEGRGPPTLRLSAARAGATSSTFVSMRRVGYGAGVTITAERRQARVEGDLDSLTVGGDLHERLSLVEARVLAWTWLKPALSSAHSVTSHSLSIRAYEDPSRSPCERGEILYALRLEMLDALARLVYKVSSPTDADRERASRWLDGDPLVVADLSIETQARLLLYYLTLTAYAPETPEQARVEDARPLLRKLYTLRLGGEA
jgi:hypothetical protein